MYTDTNCTRTHTHTGELLKYDNGRWGEVAPSNRLKLTKTEGQVWLSLYHLLLHPDCQQKYEFNSHNKSVILKVRTVTSKLTLLVFVTRDLIRTIIIFKGRTTNYIIVGSSPIVPVPHYG